MNTEIKAKWLEALRSGEYEQTTRRLERIDPDGNSSFCCLGVLCSLAVDAGVTTRSVNGVGYSAGTVMYGVHQTAGLPFEVQEWAGLEGELPVLPPDHFPHSLSSRNDRGDSFAQIADLIEEHL